MKRSRIRRLYQADYLITPDQIISNGGVLCENDRIIAVGGMSGFSLNEELELIQFENAYIWFCRNSKALSMRKDVCFH